MQGPPAEFVPYGAPAQGADLPMPPGRVEQALRQVGNGIFARIYGFSFEGHYYKMPRPLLFLLAAPGEQDGVAVNARDPQEPVAGGVREFNTRFTGVEGMDWQFGRDILVWAVDKHDIAVCLDLDIGTYDRVLLQSMAAGTEDGTFEGVPQRPVAPRPARRRGVPRRGGRLPPGSLAETERRAADGEGVQDVRSPTGHHQLGQAPAGGRGERQAPLRARPAAVRGLPDDLHGLPRRPTRPRHD